MDSVVELFEAIRTGDAEKVRSLCAANAALVNARNARGQSAVLMACYTGRKEIRDVLVENGAMLELHEAAAAGNLARVKEMAGANPELAKSYSPDGFPVLALAAAFGHEQVAVFARPRRRHQCHRDKRNGIYCADRSGRERTGLHRGVAGGKWRGRELPLRQRSFAIAGGCCQRSSRHGQNTCRARSGPSCAH